MSIYGDLDAERSICSETSSLSAPPIDDNTTSGIKEEEEVGGAYSTINATNTTDLAQYSFCSHAFTDIDASACAHCGVAVLPLTSYYNENLPALTILDRDFISETIEAIKARTSSMKSTSDALERKYIVLESLNTRNAARIDTTTTNNKKLLSSPSAVPSKKRIVIKRPEPPSIASIQQTDRARADEGPHLIGHAHKKQVQSPTTSRRDTDGEEHRALLWGSDDKLGSLMATAPTPPCAVGAVWNSADSLPINIDLIPGAEPAHNDYCSQEEVERDEGQVIVVPSSNNNNGSSNSSNKDSTNEAMDEHWLFVKFWPHRMAESFKSVSTNLKIVISMCDIDIRCRFPIKLTRDLSTKLGKAISEANTTLSWINEQQTHFYSCLEGVRYNAFDDLSSELHNVVGIDKNEAAGHKNNKSSVDSIANLEAKEVNMIIKLRDLKLSSEEIYRTWFPRNKALVGKCRAQLTRLHSLLLDDAAVAIQSKYRYHLERMRKRNHL